MSVPPLSTLTHRQVADLLPQRLKLEVEKDEAGAKANSVRFFGVPHDAKPSKTFPLLIVLGILAVIGGIFLLLAAHKILPQAANAISNLGLWGHVIGYGVGGLGLISVVLGGVLTYRNHRYVAEVRQVPANTRHTSERPRMDNYFYGVLDEKSLVAVDDPDDESGYLAAMEGAGYELRVREAGHRMFRTPERDVHVHVWKAGSHDERRHPVFRDRLRQAPDERALYESVKRRFVSEKFTDMNYYARAKGPVIEDIIGRAETWAAEPEPKAT